MTRLSLVVRRDVTAATLEWFGARPFSWKRSATCVHLVRRHLSNMGHRVPPVPRFASETSARAALAARGWADLSAMLDSFLPRIAPAEAIVGDVVELPGEEGSLGALCVVVGNGRVMGYHGSEALAVMQPHAFVGAWRA